MTNVRNDNVCSKSKWKNIRKPQIYLMIIQNIYFEVQTFL